jgi:hypothetical protein
MPRQEEIFNILPKYATVFRVIKIYIYIWWSFKLQVFNCTCYSLVPWSGVTQKCDLLSLTLRWKRALEFWHGECKFTFCDGRCQCTVLITCVLFSPWRYSPNLGLGLPPWNSPVHFGVLDLRQSVGLLGRVISSSQGLYLYTNTEKRSHTNTKHPCPVWDSNPWSRLPSERRQFMP